MSLVDDSPVNSASSDDFAAFLDAELDSTSDSVPQPHEELEEAEEEEDDHEDYKYLIRSIKRRKINVLETTEENNGSTSHIKQTEKYQTQVDICIEPGIFGGMCFNCGKKMDNQSGVPLGYIHKDLSLAKHEISRLCDTDLNFLRHKKLYLVLDLDHTLLNSIKLVEVTQEEIYVMDPNRPMKDLFKPPSLHMMTKLRPNVHNFLKEAHKLFEMYIYTMGDHPYALEMANLLDPCKVYFNNKVISRVDCTQKHQKSLDVLIGQENVVLILDDTESVWEKHKDNLILMERYLFFASSCRDFQYKSKSLIELRSDESEVDGALATVLKVLKRVHNMFFDPELGDNFEGRDARKMLRAVGSEVLKGCKIAFSPKKSKAENHHLWMIAERLGAKCSTEVDPTVTHVISTDVGTEESVAHVISTDVGTEESCWAVMENKFLVEPRWLEAASFLWQRQPEDKFPVRRSSRRQPLTD